MSINHYSAEEDAAILEAAKKFPGQTDKIVVEASLTITNREGSSISSRYHYLNAREKGSWKSMRKKKGKKEPRFTPEEDAILLSLYTQYPNNRPKLIEDALIQIPSREKIKIAKRVTYLVTTKSKKKQNQQIIVARKNNAPVINLQKHRRPGAPVSLALEVAELAVASLTYDERLLLVKTILDSENH